MLKELRIRDFQKIKKLDLELSPDITTITGASDRGKSAIVRSLKWITKNVPSGDAFINWDGAKKASVQLSFDSHILQRTKGGVKNYYKFDNHTYHSFGTGVPNTIEQALNLADINFQGQHDKMFWFSESAGEVSRQLNKIINLEIIDKTLTNLDSEKRKSNQTINIIKSRVSQARKQLKKLKYIQFMNRDLKFVEKLQNRFQKTQQDASILNDLLNKAIKHQREQTNAATLKQDADLAVQKGNLYAKTADQLIKLTLLINFAKKQQSIIDNCPPPLTSIIELRDNYYNTIQTRQKLSELLNKISIYQEEIKQWNLKKTELQKRLQEKITKLCPNGKRCPLLNL